MAGVNDLVLVHIDNKPGFYARIEGIRPDHKKGWWQVKLLALSFPLQLFTWILDSSQIDGEPFTMGGTPVKMEPVAAPAEATAEPEVREEVQETPETGAKRGTAKVVSLAERKKEK